MKKKKNNLNILFFSDSSIFNPIIRTQGLPLYKELSKYNSIIFLTFEKSSEFNKYKQFITNLELLNNLKFRYILLKKSILPSFILTFFKGFKILKNIVKCNQIDIIHSRSLLPAILAGLIKAFNRNIKVVFDIRGLVIEEEILKGSISKISAKYYFLILGEKFALKKADVFVCVSSKMKKYFQNYKKIDKKIFVIPNRAIIKDQFFNLNKKNNGVIRAIYSGSMAIWQKPEYLNRLQEVIIINNLPIELTVFTYQRKIAEQMLDPRIKIVSGEDYQSINQFWQEYDFAILLRDNILINNVASPLKFAEYLANGLPILISEGIGDYSDLVRVEKLGVVVSEEQLEKGLKEMLKLLKSEDMRKKCFDYAVKNLNINQSYKDYLEVFKYSAEL